MGGIAKMSREIDERIVEMSFDNKEFEENARTSMETLKKLDDSLKMSEGIEGLKNVASAAGNISFAVLESGIDSVSEKFSSMEVVAITIISRLTNAAMDLGKNIANSLYIEPVKSGLEEYETKMDNVQTTMINSGKSIDEVNRTLDNLNLYADKTIYKFMDMTSAVQKFTMSGITDLELVENMVKGIGNASGEAGLKAEQASSVYYMLSQALSQGKMSLYQFRTLEMTGFASSKFRKNLLETAAALGKIRDNLDGTYTGWSDTGEAIEITAENIRNSFGKSSWADAEVLQTVLARYASAETSIALGFEDISEEAYHAAQDIKTFSQMWDTMKEAAQSGWTTSWEIIFGNFEEAKQLWGSVNSVLSAVLDKQSDARNKELQIWKDLGGRSYLIGAMSAGWELLSSTLGAVSEGLSEVSRVPLGGRLYHMSKSLDEFLRKSQLTASELKSLKDVFSSVAKVIRNATSSLKSIGKTIGEAFKEIFPKKSGLVAIQKFNDTAKQISDTISEFANKLKITDGPLEKIKRTASGFFAIFDIGFELIKQVSPYISDVVLRFLPVLSDKILTLSAKFGDFIVKIRDYVKENKIFSTSIEKIIDLYNKLDSNISPITDKIVSLWKSFTSWIESKMIPAFENLGGAFGRFFTNEDGEKMSFLEKTFKVLGTILEIVFKTIGKLMPSIGKLMSFIGDAFIGGTKAFSNFLDQLGNGNVSLAVDTLYKGFASLFGLQIGWTITDFIGDIASAGKSLVDGFVNLIDLIGGLDELKDSIKFENLAKGLKTFAEAIAILAVSFILLSTVDPEKLKSTISVMTAFMVELIVVMKSLLSMTSSGDPTSFLSSIVGSISELSKSVAISQLANGLLKFAGAVAILAIAVSILSKIDTTDLIFGIGAMTLILLELVIVASILSGMKGDFNRIAKGMIELSIAMILMAKAVQSFGSSDLETIVKGLAAFSIVLYAMYKFVSSFEKGKIANMKKLGTGLILLGVAMNLLVKPIKALGEMNIVNLALGLGAFSLILFALFEFLKKMQSAKATKNMVSLGLGLVIMASAMNLMAKAVSSLGSLPIATLLEGLGAIAVLLAEIGIFSKLTKAGDLIGTSAALVIFGAAITVMAIGLKILGSIPVSGIITGMVTLAATLAILGIAATVLAPVIPAMIGLAGAMALVGLSAVLLGTGLTAISVGLASLAVGVTVGLSSLVLLIEAVVASIPIIFEAVGFGIVALVQVIGDSASVIVTSVVQVGKAILQGLIELVPQVGKLISSVLSTALGILLTYGPIFIQTITVILYNLLNSMITLLPKFGEFVVQLVTTLANTLIESAPVLTEMGFQLLISLLTGLRDHIGEIALLALEIIANFVIGIGNGIGLIIDAAFDLVISFINGITEALDDKFPLLMDALGKLGLKIIEKLMDFIADLLKFVVDLGILVSDKVLEWKDKLREKAKEVINGLIQGFKDKVADAVAEVKELGSKIIDGFKSVLGIHSPSRVFKEAAKFTVEGFVGGLGLYGKKAEEASEELGKDTVDAFNSSLGKTGSFISDDSLNPKITPVLDLTKVQNGVSRLSSLFGDQNVGVVANSVNDSSRAISDANGQAAIQKVIDSAMGKYTEAFVNAINNIDLSTNVNVGLEPNSAGLFKIIREENDRNYRATGRNILART